ncbi:HAD family hydrolase [Marinobacterium mangrovicola]|uniref:HAD superfamily hydrolase (TIGR01490 family) n=1 Tax=Marinobacterium mangrovicola TaxID=1476959 RepID=A0A4R1GJQ0_9GAMM|nr:HAD family hydrolase [Marinobacterium mangrovicola]TCK08627.1 HAD superfamily hydrolase (TIGR01490 family) [Marinobacterium mangrovicola]
MTLETLAIFDLDETLVRGDTASLFCRFMVDTGLADGTFVDQEQELMQRYADETLSMPEYVAFMLKPLRHIPAAEVQALMPAFIDGYVRHRIYPQARALIQHQREKGRFPLIISATPAFLVQAVAGELGVADVLAIDLELSERGRYTGAIEGIATYREGKVSRLHAWLEQQQKTLDGARFYTDSINDLALLEQVDSPFATNPDERLTKIAERRGWPILRWDDPENICFVQGTAPRDSVTPRSNIPETANTGR